jgi:hypothetical protein
MEPEGISIVTDHERSTIPEPDKTLSKTDISSIIIDTKP